MNMATKLLVAFAVCFTTFAQAGDMSFSSYYSQDGAYGVGFKTTFGGSTKRASREEEPMQLAAVVDTGLYNSVEECEARVQDGSAVVYSPQDLKRFKILLPDAQGNVRDPEGVLQVWKGEIVTEEQWTCSFMVTSSGQKWVAESPGTQHRYAVLDGRRSKKPYARHECGNRISDFRRIEPRRTASAPASSEQFRGAGAGTTIIIHNNIGTSNGRFDGIVKGDKEECGWCKAAWIVGGLLVGGAIIAAVSDDDDDGGRPPSGITLPPTGSPPTGTTTGGSAPSGTTTGGSAPSGTTTGGSAPSGDTTGGFIPGGTTTGGSAPSGATTGGSAPGGTTIGGSAPGGSTF